jgi:hypothetical protein
MSAHVFVRPAAAALSLLLAACAFGADAAPAGREPGDLWEVTSQMSMEGMPMQMPATTQKVCAAKTWTEPPGGNADKSCETLEFKSTATTTTWKVRCAGPPAMTGVGEITRSAPDAYKGTMTMTMGDEGSMTLKLSGRRVGDCDRGESKREVAQMRGKLEAQAAAAQQQADDAKRAACKSAVDAMDLKSMQAYASVCADAQLKSMFCVRLETEEGFQQVCERRAGSGTSLAEAASYCGKDVEALRKPICEQALNKLSLDLLGSCCPVQAKDLALRECAGRKYTAMIGSKYQSFCARYAHGVAAEGQ